MKVFRNSLRLQAAVMAAILPGFVWMPQAAWANPLGGKVISGSAEIMEPDGGMLNINQTSDRAIIEWESFSISGGETTQFLQNSSASAVLNRVTGGSGSRIDGMLKANGGVWLINQNGVVVGPGGSVDVFGFLASTLDVSNGAFMNGGDVTLAGGSMAATQNFGKINAVGGDVFLVGRMVENHGTIGAVDGMVGLAAGNEVLLKSFGGERLFVTAGSGSRVTNTGQITSSMAELKAHGNVGALAVNNTGAIRATSSANRNGRVVLASNQGNISNTGSIDSRNLDGSGGEIDIRTGQGEIHIGGIISATGVAGSGGNVRILGDTVNVSPGAVVDASGDDGGSIDITSPTEGRVEVGPGSRLAAEGRIGSGGRVNVSAGDIVIYGDSTLGADGEVDGGMVALNGSGMVLVDGGISALGGTGNGGQVNISGEDVLVGTTGSIDASGAGSGGRVNMSAVDQLVVSGSVAARGESGQGGTVQLAGTDVLVSQTGRVDASGASGGTVGISASGEAFIAGEVAARGTDGAGGTIGVSGKDVTVAGGGLVDASGANGGGFVAVSATDTANVFGTVLATGGSGAGGTVEMNGTDVVVGSAGVVDAGGASGGTVSLDGSASTEVAGRVAAVGSEGSGGSVNLTGGEVDVLGTANVDAGGVSGGGQVNIGGGFQGNDPGLRNSQRTSIASGAVINSNSSQGDGGRIAIWSDGATDFQGTANSEGGVNGGLIEVSGLQHLAFNGNVSTVGLTGRNGNLLLDPVDVILGTGGIDLTALGTALNSSNVVIHTSSDVVGPTESGTILMPNGTDFRYTSVNSLSLFAHRDIAIGGILKNHGSGNINLFAGWSGTGADLFTNPDGTLGNQSHTSAAGAISAADILAGNFGAWGTNGVGRVTINPDQVSTASVGSAGGETNVFGHSVLMLHGDAAGEFSQIGYRPEDGAGIAPTGDINVYSNSNIIMTSASSNRNAHIGHGGGNNASGMAGQIEVDDVSMSGNITIRARGALVMNSVGGDSYNMVGHGGMADDSGPPDADYARIDGNMSGNIDMETAFLVMTGNGSRAPMQIGHGGFRVKGEHFGDIRLIATNGIEAAAPSVAGVQSNYDQSYIQIGHGGYVSGHALALPFGVDGDSNVGDEITTVDVANALASGDDPLITAQIGLSATTGDYRKIGNSGNIYVESLLGDISFKAGGVDGYNLIGHGGRDTPGENGGWDIDNADGDGDWATGTDGDITVIAGGGIKFDRFIRGRNSDGTIQYAGGDRAFSMIGHGGWRSAGGGHGDIKVEARGGTFEMYGGRSNAFAQVGHGGRMDFVGVTTPNRFHDDTFAQGTHSGNITVTALQDIIFRAGFGRGSTQYAQIGHGGFENMVALDSSGALEGFHGDITVTSQMGGIDFYAGQKSTDALFDGQADYDRNANDSFVMIGHGGRRARGDHYGNITVTAAGDISIEATGGWDGVGFQNDAATPADENSNTALGIPGYSTWQNNSLTGDRNFAMIGHGGHDSEGRATSSDMREVAGANSVGLGVLGESNIVITAGGNLRVAAAQKVNQGPNDDFLRAIGAGTNPLVTGDGTLPEPVESAHESFAQIGHGGYSTEVLAEGNGHRGSISIIVGGGVDLLASDFEKALIAAELAAHGTPYGITFTGETRDVRANYAQIGHGGANARGDHFGDIGILAGSDILVSAGTAEDAYAQIGSGGVESEFPNNINLPELRTGSGGNISVTTTGGSVQVLGGGQNPDQDAIGNDDPDTAGQNPNPGDDTRAMYALIGNGGTYAWGAHYGDVTVNAALDVILKGSLGDRDGFAQIGTGGNMEADSNLIGHTYVTVGRDLWLERGPDTSQNGTVLDNNYAKIGLGIHKTDPDRRADAGIRRGDVEVDVTGTLTNLGGLIGHVDTVQGGHTSLFGSNEVSGHTWIRANQLVADGRAAFSSGTNGLMDELRIYLPDRAANDMEGSMNGGQSAVGAGTILNGSRYRNTPFDDAPPRVDEVFGVFENMGEGTQPLHGMGGFYGLFYGRPDVVVPPPGGGGGGGGNDGGAWIPTDTPAPPRPVVLIPAVITEQEINVFIPQIIIPPFLRFRGIIEMNPAGIDTLDGSTAVVEGPYSSINENSSTAPQDLGPGEVGFSPLYPGTSTGSVYSSRNVDGGGFLSFGDPILTNGQGGVSDQSNSDDEELRRAAKRAQEAARSGTPASQPGTGPSIFEETGVEAPMDVQPDGGNSSGDLPQDTPPAADSFNPFE